MALRKLYNENVDVSNITSTETEYVQKFFDDMVSDLLHGEYEGRITTIKNKIRQGDRITDHLICMIPTYANIGGISPIRFCHIVRNQKHYNLNLSKMIPDDNSEFGGCEVFFSEPTINNELGFYIRVSPEYKPIPDTSSRTGGWCIIV